MSTNESMALALAIPVAVYILFTVVRGAARFLINRAARKYIDEVKK